MRAASLLLVALVAAPQLSAQQPDIGPPPGRLVDIGGRKLHLICSGSGLPTVVLEAGASSFAIDWTLVQSQIARTNRVCSYDRAGMGWSDPRGDVDTPARIVADLRALLVQSRERPPFVLVGASAGALYVRLYQLDYPDDVFGMVLVDPATEDRLFTMYQGQAVAIASLDAEQLRTTLPTSAVPVPRREPQSGAPFDRLPADLYQLRLKLEQRLIASVPETVPASVVQESAEGERAALARLLESRLDPEAPIRRIPLVVLTRGQDMTLGIMENHEELARLSTNNRHSLIRESGHEIHLFAAPHVALAIGDVVTVTRRGVRLPRRP